MSSLRPLALVFLTLFVISSGSAIEIPYEGMNIRSTSQGSISCSGETTDSWSRSGLFAYKEKNGDIFAVETSDGEELKYDSQTREIITSENLSKSSHWIDTAVSVGEDVEISGNTYEVVSLSTSVDTNFGQIEAIELEKTYAATELVTNENADGQIAETAYYDKESGIFVKSVFDGSYRSQGIYSSYVCDYDSERLLKDTGVDFNDNGVSNLEEIIVENKDPRVRELNLEIEVESKTVKQGDTLEVKALADGENVEFTLHKDGEEIEQGKSIDVNLDKPGNVTLKASKKDINKGRMIKSYKPAEIVIEVESLSILEKIGNLFSGFF